MKDVYTAVFELGTDPEFMAEAARLRASMWGFSDVEVLESSIEKTKCGEVVLVFVAGDREQQTDGGPGGQIFVSDWMPSDHLNRHVGRSIGVALKVGR